MNTDHFRLVRELASAYALVGATDSGLLDALVNDGGTSAELAGALQLDRDAMDRMLDVLEASGWAECDDDRWRAAEWIRDAGAGGLTFHRTAHVFRHFESMLDDGSVALAGDVRHDARGVRGLAELFGDAPERLAAILPEAAGTILDLGAGSAVWSLAMVQDGVEVVAVDREEVLRAATALAVDRGLSERLRTLPGSFWEVELPPANRVVIANVVHLLDDDESRRLVDRAIEALAPGGELVIVDVLGSENPSLDVTAYALHLRLREPHGTVHAEHRMSGWLLDAGLADVYSVHLHDEMALGAIVGRRA